MRLALKPVLVALALVAMSPAPAGAVLSDSGSGGSKNTDMTGGGGGGGRPTVWDIRNAEMRLNWPSASTLDAYRADSSSKTVQKQVSELLGRDRCSSSFTAPNCVLWENRTSSDNWGYEVHNQPGPLGDDAITGWNIKIWREGEDHPIFERRVCDTVDRTRGSDTDRSTATNWNRLWWTCGGEGSHSLDGTTRGMLSVQNEQDRANCRANLRDARNGDRDSQGRSVNEPGAGPRFPNNAETLDGEDSSLAKNGIANGGFWCYWEADQLGRDREN